MQSRAKMQGELEFLMSDKILTVAGHRCVTGGQTSLIQIFIITISIIRSDLLKNSL